MDDRSGPVIVEKILETVNLDGKQVLEVGCGDGRITALLTGRPAKLVAVDPDASSIAKARKDVPGVTFKQSSGENLPFPDQSFDLVLFSLSLHHQDSRTALREASRVLRDSGDIIVIEPVVEGELERIFALVYNEDQDKTAAQQAIKTSGLPLVHTETFSAFWSFSNKSDLCQSVFDYYNLPVDPLIADRMLEILGDRAEMQPIELEDRMIVQHLKNA